MRNAIIFGTGALATRMGWHLAHAGVDVTLVGTWQAALDAVAADGIELEVHGVLMHAPAASARLGDPVGPAPLVLVLEKSHRTAAVAYHAVRAAVPGGLVLTLQNGLGNREILAAEAMTLESTPLGNGSRSGSPPEKITVGEGVSSPEMITIGVGVTSLGSMSTGPGRALAGGSGETVLGAPPDMAPGARAVVEALADLLRSENLEVSFEADIDAIVWRKLAVNCAINPLSAIHGVPNGRLLEDQESLEILRSAAGEVAVVAAALGIKTGGPDELAALAETVARRTAANRSSMLQDFDRGALTEIDALSGAVVEHGKRTGVPTPVNERLWREIRAIEGRALQEAETWSS